MRSLAGFPGKIVAVHPREREIQGLPAYPTLGDVPEPVDLAVLAIPARHCVEAARDAARASVGGIFIISGGFAESGDEGRALQEQLAEVCRTKADRDAICQAVIAVGRLLCEHPEVREVEINPLRVNAQGAVALDGLVLIDDEL